MTKAVDELLDEYETPNAGTTCVRCSDWGTVVILRGKTSYEVLCPKECETAQRVQKLREGRDREASRPRLPR